MEERPKLGTCSWYILCLCNIVISSCLVKVPYVVSGTILQKINHFYGMLELCRKKAMAKHLAAMAMLQPQQYNFFPLTFTLPDDYAALLADAKSRGKKQIYIIKPDAGCQVNPHPYVYGA